MSSLLSSRYHRNNGKLWTVRYLVFRQYGQQKKTKENILWILSAHSLLISKYSCVCITHKVFTYISHTKQMQKRENTETEAESLNTNHNNVHFMSEVSMVFTASNLSTSPP